MFVQGDNSVVFHVAEKAMTSQPTGSDNLEVKVQGQTKVLLTAESNLIEVHDLKQADTDQPSYPGAFGGRGRGRGRGGRDTLTRFLEREERVVGQGRPAPAAAPPPAPPVDTSNNCVPGAGPGWFMWREWKVNPDFMDSFNIQVEMSTIFRRTQYLEKVLEQLNVTWSLHIKLGHLTLVCKTFIYKQFGLSGQHSVLF